VTAFGGPSAFLDLPHFFGFNNALCCLFKYFCVCSSFAPRYLFSAGEYFKPAEAKLPQNPCGLRNQILDSSSVTWKNSQTAGAVIHSLYKP
jgi:hypothetical protein